MGGAVRRDNTPNALSIGGESHEGLTLLQIFSGTIAKEIS
jgi:hypothetical protein